MIIDAHTHLNLFSDKYTTPEQRVIDMKKFMKKAGISKAIVLSIIKGPTKEYLDTQKIIDLVKAEKNIFVIAGMSVNYTKKDLEQTREYIKQKKIIGIKLYPGYEPFYPADPRLDKIYDLCEEFDIPIVFHSGDTYKFGAGVKYSHPLHIDDVALKRPKMKIVIAHLGNPWLIDTMEVLYRHENVYADISELVWTKFDSYFTKYYSQQIIHILKWSEKNKLLFGTDWPCNDEKTYPTYMKQYVDFVNKLKISKEDKEKIFHLNAEKVFKI